MSLFLPINPFEGVLVNTILGCVGGKLGGGGVSFPLDRRRCRFLSKWD